MRGSQGSGDASRVLLGRRAAVGRTPASRLMSWPSLPGRLTSVHLRRLLPTLLLVGGLACTPSSPDAGRGPATDQAHAPLPVVTSITVLADLVRQVGGGRVEVKTLVPSGADPNTFQPPHRDVLVVSQAKIVFFNGLGLDRTVRGVLNNASRPDLPLVVLSDGLPTLESGLTSLDAAPGGSPLPVRGNAYLWLDPRRAATYVERIRDGLVAVDADGAASYQANAGRYLAGLKSLDEELEAQLAAIPRERRKLVTMHDAFPYLADRYGLQLVAVAIKTPGREPSAQEIADVSRAVQEHRVPTVFIEPQLDSRLLKLAARDAGVRIGTLYSDTLDQHVPTYEALLRYNARQLVNGLN
jgi:ABC-type Zn uptake system ZnuABC Zn-binding protein ZnuA